MWSHARRMHHLLSKWRRCTKYLWRTKCSKGGMRDFHEDHWPMRQHAGQWVSIVGGVLWHSRWPQSWHAKASQGTSLIRVYFRPGHLSWQVFPSLIVIHISEWFSTWSFLFTTNVSAIHLTCCSPNCPINLQVVSSSVPRHSSSPSNTLFYFRLMSLRWTKLQHIFWWDRGFF